MRRKNWTPTKHSWLCSPLKKVKTSYLQIMFLLFSTLLAVPLKERRLINFRLTTGERRLICDHRFLLQSVMNNPSHPLQNRSIVNNLLHLLWSKNVVNNLSLPLQNKLLLMLLILYFSWVILLQLPMALINVTLPLLPTLSQCGS